MNEQNRHGSTRWASLPAALGIVVLAVMVGPTWVSADVELPAVFGSRMVLQSGVSVPIWGMADDGEVIVIEFGDQRVTTRADSQGHWSVALAPLTPSAKSRALVVTGNNQIRLSDVLVGEVWFCAGQSNMEWPLRKSTGAAIETANDPAIRLLYLRGAARGGSGKYTPEHLARLTPQEFCQGEWSLCHPQTASEFSAVAYFFGHRLHQELKVPVGLICSAIGGTPAEAWISRAGLESSPETAPLVQGDWMENNHLSAWCRDRARFNFSRARAAGEAIPGDDLGPHHSFKPTFMYEAGVAPIIPFGIRGVIWYQGESNAENAARVAQHELLFSTLVHQWRKAWKQGDFPFIYVQLPAMGRPDWPAFRDQQRRFLGGLSNVGMAITIDVGHPTNVHPANKRPVGERLASWALVNTYEHPAISASGPLVKSCRLKGGQLTIRFEHTGDALTTGDGKPPRHFQILDEDAVWRTLHVGIHGDELRADVSQLVSPRSVRYAWEPYPKPPVNLMNSARIPASPFEIEVSVHNTKQELVDSPQTR